MAREKIESSKTIKSKDADDREANGEQPFSEPEPHRALTEEEAEQVLAKLENHEGIKRHNLLVKMTLENGQKIVRVETPEGQVVKRFVERDLYFLLIQNNEDGIRLFKKAA